MKKIAIQGGYGAFHEIAAHYYFKGEDVEITPRNTFKELFHSLNNGQSELGITAIENSIAGSILPNYTYLKDTEMRIIGEIYLRIKQNLVALPGQRLEDLEEVFSHPMAILQCQDFFDHYPKIRLTESPDTALSAKQIAENQLYKTGAIASSQAADAYGLEVLAEGIETNKKNYTRFVILGPEKEADKISQVNKASLHFTLSHSIGSLSKVLSILSFYEINLTKIQSMPIVGSDMEYRFYIDVLIDDYTQYTQSLTAIRPFTSELSILGEYRQGEKIL